MATAALSPGDIAWPVRSVFAGQKNVRVMMMDVNAVDTAARTVSDGVTTLAYDYLVVATGRIQRCKIKKKAGAPDTIRTCDLCLRRATL